MPKRIVAMLFFVATASNCSDDPLNSDFLGDIAANIDANGRSVDTSNSEDSSASPAICASDECDIGGACYVNGEANPEQSCLVCLVVLDRMEWSPDDSQTCEDDDPCTVNETCTDGACEGSPACDDGNPCTDDICDESTGECSSSPNDAACVDDNAPCNEAQCVEGVCTAISSARQCDDGNACTQDTCSPTLGCVYTPNDGAPCDDSEPCTADDTCTGQICTGGPTNCDDGNVCTVDACQAGTGCVNKTISDNCTDGNPCTDDGCDPQLGCVFPPNSEPCDDGSLCTIVDTCAGGICAGTALPIEDGNACTTGACDPTIGIVQSFNTAPCDDGDVCNTGDTCENGQCIAGAILLECDDASECTDDSCDPSIGCINAPNNEDCDDGTVCTTNDVCSAGTCTGTTVTCDDDNLCTTDTCDAESGCIFTVIPSNACRPTIDVVYPPRGATIAGNMGTKSITVNGSVYSDAGAITAFSINDVEVPLPPNGIFSVEVPVQVGGNTLVMKATDALGTPRQRVQAFLWSDGYLKPTEPLTDAVAPGLGIWFSQNAIDDGDTSLPPNDLATIFKLVLDQFDISALLGGGSGPIANQGGFKIYLDTLTYGGTSIDLQAVDGGLSINASINSIDGKLIFDCTNFLCQLAGGDSSGGLTVDSVSINALILLSATADGQLDVQLTDVSTQFDGINIYSNNGWTNFLLSIIEGAIIGGVVGDLQNELNGQLNDLLAPLLGEALGALAFNLALDLPKLDGSGEIAIALATNFQAADFQDADPGPQGGALTQKAGAYTDATEPPYVNFGIPKRSGCGLAPQTLAIPKQGALELVLSDDLLNHILYAAWRGGLLEFDVPTSLLGDFDLTQFGISDLDLTLSGLLAPTASDCGPDGQLLVHIGDARIDASLSLFGQPLTLVVWASFSAALELTATDGSLGINITGISNLDTEVNVDQDSLIGSETVIKQLIEEQLVGGLLELLGGGALGTIPLPAIDLSSAVGLAPGSAVIAISPQSVTRVDGNSVVQATLAQ